MAPPATLAPGCHRLVWDVQGDAHVHNTVTGETVKLGDSDDGAWQMDTDERGVDYVYQEDVDGESWIPDLLKYRVFTGAGLTQIEVPQLGDNLMPLSTFESLHETFDVSVRHVGDVNVNRFRIEAFFMRYVGQRFFWPLFTLIRIVLLPFSKPEKRKATAPSRILGRRMEAWKNLASTIGSPLPRRSKPKSDKPQVRTLGEPARVLSTPTVNSTLLVAILLTLATRPAEVGGCQDERASAAAHRLLESFISRGKLTSVTMRLLSHCSMDSSGIMTQAPDHSVRYLTLCVTDLFVDVKPLAAYVFPPRCKAITTQMRSMMCKLQGRFDLCRVPLIDLLSGMMEAKLPMWKDIVHQTACALEATLESELQALSDPEFDPAKVAEEHLRRPTGSGLTTQQMATANVARLEAIRERCVDRPNFFSIATDAAKVGFKSRQNSLIVLPDNSSSWAPPAV